MIEEGFRILVKIAWTLKNGMDRVLFYRYFCGVEGGYKQDLWQTTLEVLPSLGESNFEYCFTIYYVHSFAIDKMQVVNMLNSLFNNINRETKFKYSFTS